MLANRRVDTKPEVAVRSALHRRGYRFRKDFRVELGLGRANPRPDIAFTAAKVAVFIDGCFWHGCPEHGHIPNTRAGFWAEKFDRNKRRDRANDEALHDAGWRVVRLWEHEPLTQAVAAVEVAINEHSAAR